jgi:predicted AlkP superfamily phosphohydrolase/phosphomutase
MKKESKIRDRIEVATLCSLFLLSISAVHADEQVHSFKNPSFSGIGTSAHYLTIENQEKSRRDKIRDDIEAALKAAEREEQNSTLAKFIRNLESRIYAQLSKQLVDNMFGNDEASYSGSFTLEGNTITYQRTEQCQEDGACIEVIIMTITDSEGSETVITIPIGTGGF